MIFLEVPFASSFPVAQIEDCKQSVRKKLSYKRDTFSSFFFKTKNLWADDHLIPPKKSPYKIGASFNATTGYSLLQASRLGWWRGWPLNLNLWWWLLSPFVTNTLPKFNSSPLKSYLPNRKLVFQAPFFQGLCSTLGGVFSRKLNLPPLKMDGLEDLLFFLFWHVFTFQGTC